MPHVLAVVIKGWWLIFQYCVLFLANFGEGFRVKSFIVVNSWLVTLNLWLWLLTRTRADVDKKHNSTCGPYWKSHGVIDILFETKNGVALLLQCSPARKSWTTSRPSPGTLCLASVLQIDSWCSSGTTMSRERETEKERGDFSNTNPEGKCNNLIIR